MHFLGNDITSEDGTELVLDEDVERVSVVLEVVVSSDEVLSS